MLRQSAEVRKNKDSLDPFIYISGAMAEDQTQAK
jgi:hypothetical protein